MQEDLSFLEFAPDFNAPRIVEAYDELPLWSAMFGQLLLHEVPLAQIACALDIGCGTGFPLIELAERLGPRTQVHGIDPWSAGLRRAAAKMAIRGCRNITLHEGSASSLPFDDATFDLIVSNLGLNNFADPRAAIRECLRVARRGCTLALSTNLQGHMQEFYEVFAAILERASDEAALQRLHDHIEHRATIAKVQSLLTAAGFVIKRIVEQRATMRFADGTALFNHHFIKLGFLSDWKQVVAGSEAVSFSALCQELNDRAQRLGELCLTIPMAYIEAVAV
jgi:ubiquinone/menaquinone biosynthesis C-methylase UbiE